ncbi:hypothetical protein BT93_A1825 [Corymbia citriodora subsp. variegata]|nr:hypothetical protein BT93_A1825 [Corymbia citriodora subsp. variegata]
MARDSCQFHRVRTGPFLPCSSLHSSQFVPHGSVPARQTPHQAADGTGDSVLLRNSPQSCFKPKPSLAYSSPSHPSKPATGLFVFLPFPPFSTARDAPPEPKIFICSP